MCGIAGWLLDDPRRQGADELQRMLEALSHRGPDDTGTYIHEDPGVALGHNRLSIIDLTSGRSSANGECRQWRRTDVQWRDLQFSRIAR